MDLVIGVGFIFTDDINQLSVEYPNVNFADVDYSVGIDKQGRVIPPPPNVAAAPREIPVRITVRRLTRLP